MNEKKTSLKELQTIPGVGKSIAIDLYDLGYSTIEKLKGQDPEEMYVRHNIAKGQVHDICLLYTFRCAVYFANTPPHKLDPQKLKWWKWMDAKKISSEEKDRQIREKIKL